MLSGSFCVTKNGACGFGSVPCVIVQHVDVLHGAKEKCACLAWVRPNTQAGKGCRFGFEAAGGTCVCRQSERRNVKPEYSWRPLLSTCEGAFFVGAGP